MNAAKIAREMASLPPEAQKEVIDFLAFLKTRYASAPAAKKRRQTKLAAEPFVGMWRAREDMRDSVTWVRNLRQDQWERNR